MRCGNTHSICRQYGKNFPRDMFMEEILSKEARLLLQFFVCRKSLFFANIS